MDRQAEITKATNGYMVVLVSCGGMTNERTEKLSVFRNWSEVMVCVSEFFGEYEGD